jgi:transcriptional regulator with XRE-family HTH domain
MYLVLHKLTGLTRMRSTTPATSPSIDVTQRATLAALGSRVRARRKQLRVSATSAAEAAGISRVTLHRIERGEPSVTIGAYLNAMSAIGLELRAAESEPHRADTTSDAAAPERIRITDYPQLRRITWQLSEFTEVTLEEALNLYERNWRHVDHTAMDERERDFVQHLVDTYGGGLLLV